MLWIFFWIVTAHLLMREDALIGWNNVDILTWDIRNNSEAGSEMFRTPITAHTSCPNVSVHNFPHDDPKREMPRMSSGMPWRVAASLSRVAMIFISRAPSCYHRLCDTLRVLNWRITSQSGWCLKSNSEGHGYVSWVVWISNTTTTTTTSPFVCDKSTKGTKQKRRNT